MSIAGFQNVLTTYVDKMEGRQPWPIERDIETEATVVSMVHVSQVVTDEYTSLRRRYTREVSMHRGAMTLQRAWRRHRGRQVLHAKTLQLHRCLLDSLGALEARMQRYGEERLAPSLEELANMPQAMQRELLYSMRGVERAVDEGQPKGADAATAATEDEADLDIQFSLNLLKLLTKNRRKQRRLFDSAVALRPEQGRVALLLCHSRDTETTRVEQLLQDNKFRVLKATAPTLQELREVVEVFSAVSKSGLLLFVFYIGRTLSTEDGTFYLVPSDAAADVTASTAPYECFDIKVLYDNLSIPKDVLSVLVFVDDTAPTPHLPLPKVAEGYVITCNSEAAVVQIAISLANTHSVFTECLQYLAAHNPSVAVQAPSRPLLPFFFAQEHHAPSHRYEKDATAVDALLKFGVHTGRLERQSKAVLQKYALP